MSRITPVLLVVCFLSSAIYCSAQKEAKISNPSIELIDQKLIITYDILESKESDRFHIRLEVTDSAGNQLDVRAVDGDIGVNVSGGAGKQIYWDINADGIYIDADIYIQVYADRIPLAADSSGAEFGEFNRTGIILQSLLVPGLGLSRAKGGPHWLRGVAGYGCVAGSVVLNRMAINTYEEYKTSESAEDATKLLNKSIQQDNTSQILAYSAIGIWLVDIVWTVVGTRDLKKEASSSATGLSIGTNYDSLTKSPLLAIRYQF